MLSHWQQLGLQLDAMAVAHDAEEALEAGDLERAEVLLGKARALFERLGMHRRVAGIDARLGEVLTRQGRPLEAEASWWSAIDWWRRDRSERTPLAASLRQLARVYLQLGRPAQAADLLAEAGANLVADRCIDAALDCQGDLARVLADLPVVEPSADVLALARDRIAEMAEVVQAGADWTAALADFDRG